MKNKQGTNKKIVVILGTTASGKTSLGVKLAKKFNGEIISADSRQVYKGMDIGTGKDLKEYDIKIKKQSKIINFRVPYHLIDVVSPKTEFNLAKFQKLARKAIDDVLERGKLPIVVGGTGLYLQALVDGYELSAGKPDQKLRERLEKKSLEDLVAYLVKLDINKTTQLNDSDIKNKRRLIRQIEMLKHGEGERKKPLKKYESLLIGLAWPKDELDKRIYKRLIDRFEEEGMIGEVARLHKQGVSWKRLEGFGLEYKFISLYLQNKLPLDEMVEKLFIASRQFAKRQGSWFRRWEREGAKIHWLNSSKSLKNSQGLIKNFLK